MSADALYNYDDPSVRYIVDRLRSGEDVPLPTMRLAARLLDSPPTERAAKAAWFALVTTPEYREWAVRHAVEVLSAAHGGGASAGVRL